MTRLDGRRALVTGGTGGIGRAIAARLAGAGATVVITGRDARRGEEVAARLRADGAKADFVQADLSGGGAAVRELVDRAGEIDILVNNAAAVVTGNHSMLDATEQQIDAVLGMNVKVPFLLASALVPGMIARGGGAVVNIGSIAGSTAPLVTPVYGASKAALHLLTKSWAVELAAKGVRVNAVAPGPVVTELDDAARLARVSEVGAGFPSGRPSTADEVAAAVLFLAGDEAANIHGVIIPVDGGGSVI